MLKKLLISLYNLSCDITSFLHLTTLRIPCPTHCSMQGTKMIKQEKKERLIIAFCFTFDVVGFVHSRLSIFFFFFLLLFYVFPEEKEKF
jgi:hypothetical protein